jgi:hypothetical protein
MTLALALLGALLAAAPRAGSVRYVTEGRLYLDAGSRDGLAEGQIVQLLRGGRPSGTCKIQHVSDSHATCVGSGAKGDSFALAARAPVLAVRRAQGPEAPEIVARRRAAVESAGYQKVESAAPPEGPAPAPLKAVVSLSHTSWVSTVNGPWHEERADVSLHDVELGKGFTFDAELSARRWSLRSGAVSFRPDDPTQLYVWEAAISRRPSEGLALSFGRVRPRVAPGQVIFDGAQAGWRTGPSSEAGVFGGVVPDAVTTAPSLNHGTFGGYWAGENAFDSVVRLLRHEARIAFIDTDELGARAEGEGLLEVWLGRALDASTDLRFGKARGAPAELDAARVDGNLRLFDSLSITGGFRYDGLNVPQLDGPGVVAAGGAGRRADLGAQWEPLPVLRLSVVSGLSSDLTTGLERRWVGPEVGSPRLFGDTLGVAAGYLAEDGWAAGRGAYVQIIFRQRSRLQLLARVSWDRLRSGLSPLETDEMGAFASARAQLTDWLSLRVSGLLRSSLDGGQSTLGGQSAQFATLSADLAGAF